MHIREHRSLLANSERRLLISIARQLPSWVQSDHLTLLGLVAMPAAGLAFATLQYSWLNVGALVFALFANWFGDSLDGTLARVRCQPRPRYGYYVDHVIDLFGTAAVVAGMGASGLMTPTIALVLLVAYFLVSAETFLATHTVGVFRLSFALIGPTELRILLSGVIAAAGLVAVFVLSALRNTRALYLSEPIPKRATIEDAEDIAAQSLARFAQFDLRVPCVLRAGEVRRDM